MVAHLILLGLPPQLQILRDASIGMGNEEISAEAGVKGHLLGEERDVLPVDDVQKHFYENKIF